MKFLEALAHSVKFIKDGGLKLAEGDSQVSEKAFPLLLQMNELGMLTFDSQSGERQAYKAADYNQFKAGVTKERAYVDGFMLTEHAVALVNCINLTTDKVGMVLQPVPKWIPSAIPVTQAVRCDGTLKIGTQSPLYVDKKLYLFEQTLIKIDAAEDVRWVFIFDPVWCRKGYGPKGLFKDVVNTLKKMRLGLEVEKMR
jgi:hypothetical protein